MHEQVTNLESRMTTELSNIANTVCIGYSRALRGRAVQLHCSFWEHVLLSDQTQSEYIHHQEHQNRNRSSHNAIRYSFNPSFNGNLDLHHIDFTSPTAVCAKQRDSWTIDSICPVEMISMDQDKSAEELDLETNIFPQKSVQIENGW